MEEVTKERRDEIFRRIAEKVVEMKLTPVAIVMLESSKPISFVGSQLMVFFQPIYSAIFPARPYNEITTLLEDRANLELLIKEIEKVEEEKRKEPRVNPVRNNQDGKLIAQKVDKNSETYKISNGVNTNEHGKSKEK